ncbi:MAG: tetratricopeptide repeat protein [Lachnospiraceae bacterium]|nr:tetratricopeptide repeat protein [Lachnospiraceae bacterium]
MAVKDVSGVYKKADKAYNQIGGRYSMGMEELEMTKDNIQIRCTNRSCYFHSKYIPWPVNTPLMPCQLCGSDMEQLKDSENELGWLLKIADDEDKWALDVENTFPAVLAYEYKCLKEYCKKEEPFAVLLSIKDNFEALLKFEVLLAYAWAVKNTNDAFKAGTISSIATPNLTFGAWIKLASIIVRDLKKVNLQLPDIIPLDSLRKIYIEEKIVNWRNANIGHGAMAIVTDEEFREDIHDKILLLKEIYDNYGHEFEAQKIYLKDDINEDLDFSLMGADRARGLEHTGKVYFRGEGTGLDFSVDPFLVIRKHQVNGYGIYFFDNQRTKSLTHFLAYAEGRKTSENVAFFEQLRKQLDTTGKINPGAIADERDLTPEEIRELDMLQMSHEFVNPRHLVNWLTNCIKKYAKGIFLLQMDRGTGKSIFTEKLNSLTEKALVITDDMEVRTYHISSTQSAGMGYFRSEIEELWRRDYEGNTITRLDGISELEKAGKSPAEALCGYLNQVLDYIKRRRNKSRVLMVLDGLDEIPGEDLWKFIPKVNMLNEGMYFLLTSRNPKTENLPAETSLRINELEITDRYCPERQGEDNIGFLKDYMENIKLVEHKRSDTVQRLIALSDYRALELGLLCRLAENGMKISDLPDSSKVVSVYLKILEKRYGEKESIGFREVLAILCTLGSYEGLTLKTLGLLTRENGITLRLVGMISDLSPMLKVERGTKGNLYMVANPGLAKELQNQIPETEDVVRGIIDLTMALIDDDSYKDGELNEIVVHIVELARDMTSEGVKIFGNKIEDKLLKVIDYISDSNMVNKEKIVVNIKNQVVLLNKELFGDDAQNTLLSEARLAGAMLLGGFPVEALKKYRDLYNKAADAIEADNCLKIEICGGLSMALETFEHYEEALYYQLKANEALDTKDVTTLLMFKAGECSLLCKAGRYDESYTLNREISKTIKKNKIDDVELNRIVSQCKLEYFDATGKNRKVKKLTKKLTDKGKEYKKVDTNNFTFNDDLNDALVCINKDDYEGAIEAYKKAYPKMKEELGYQHPSTIRILSELASVLSIQKNYAEAIRIYQELIIIVKEIPEINDSLVMNIKREYAYALRMNNQYVDSLDIYMELYEFYKSTYGEKDSKTKKIRKEMRPIAQIVGMDLSILRNKKWRAELSKERFGKDHPETIELEKGVEDFLRENKGIEKYYDNFPSWIFK